jgi:hypothetical protein
VVRPTPVFIYFYDHAFCYENYDDARFCFSKAILRRVQQKDGIGNTDNVQDRVRSEVSPGSYERFQP